MCVCLQHYPRGPKPLAGFKGWGKGKGKRQEERGAGKGEGQGKQGGMGATGKAGRGSRREGERKYCPHPQSFLKVSVYDGDDFLTYDDR